MILEGGKREMVNNTFFRSTAIEQPGKASGLIYCFIPCCERKETSGNIVIQQYGISPQELPDTWNLLTQGRSVMSQFVNQGSLQTAAIYLYKGYLYHTLQPYINAVLQKVFSGELRIIIISAGYGVIDAFEPIHNYDATLQGEAAYKWKENRLVDVIGDLLLANKPSMVFGFFAGKRDWTGPGAKYRYFFSEGLRKALESGLTIECGGCFFRVEGLGVPAILGSLGKTFLDFMQSGFDTRFILDTEKQGRNYGTVTIGFDRFV